ncbi:MFS transporter [Deinococcus sp. Arct2-2]|uniref:MFS transporter n=1 Tax=Deinococcus sp. Arct2-2 TaxID=2568653 RepID=UPI0010A49569|nr:MFS transporter [Deinococcus sp. Arct2-2]THF69695.1 MFS transporter [Deinococcus sp. Arct2-2]
MTPIALPDAAPGRWSALTWLASAVFLSMSPWFSAAAVLPHFRALWMLTAGAAAWLTLAVQLGFVVGAVLSAAFNLADRITPQRLILIGALLAGAANLGLLVTGTPTLAMLLRALTGAALALVYPPALKAMSGWFRTGRGLALGVMVGALTLGSALPHLVNGLSVNSVGGANWQAVIVATSLLAVLGGVIASQVRSGPFAASAAPLQPAQAWRLLTGPNLSRVTLGYLGHMWELYALWAWYATFFSQLLASRDWPDPLRGAAFATFAVVGVGAIGCGVGGILGDRWGRPRLTVLSMTLSGGCALVLAALVWAGAGTPLLLAVSLVWGFWIIADSAQFSTLASELADPAYVGTALTAQLALGFSLTAASIALVPVLVGAWGWPAAFIMLAVGPLLGAVAMRPLLHPARSP